jgi:hypothetical protein
MESKSINQEKLVEIIKKALAKIKAKKELENSQVK